jgi:hypothetical protein
MASVTVRTRDMTGESAPRHALRPTARRIRLPSRLTLLAMLAAIQWIWFIKAVPQLHGNDFGIFYRSVASAAPYVPHPDNPSMAAGQLLTNLNPPQFHLIVAPFTRLPFWAACGVWWLMNGLLLATALSVWLREQGHSWSAERIVWALLWAPVVTMGFTGQVTAVLGVPLWFGYRAAAAGRSYRAGLLFGLVFSVKPILWPLAFWFVVRGAWRTVLGAAAGVALAISVGVWLYGVQAYFDWFETLRHIAWGAQVMNASIAAIGVRLALPVPAAVWLVIGTVLALGTVWRTRHRPLQAAWLSLIAASLLASPLGWIYYGAWLLPGSRLEDWTRWPGLGWSAPLIAVAGFGNLGLPFLATVGSCYALTLLALWWRSIRPEPARLGQARAA